MPATGPDFSFYSYQPMSRRSFSRPAPQNTFDPVAESEENFRNLLATFESIGSLARQHGLLKASQARQWSWDGPRFEGWRNNFSSDPNFNYQYTWTPPR